MNKNLYRIIFSEVRGMFIAVAENTKSKTKQAGQSGAITVTEASNSIKPIYYKKLNVLNYFMALSLGALTISMPLSAVAENRIVADNNAPKQQQATILNSSNGVPQVNIQTPSAGGVSRNTYSQFDVEQQGVILNNSRNNTQSQLGGWVQGNPWLAKGEAKIILNEVNSNNPSQLKGYIEVAGQKAQVIIANPAGLVCDGCGVINADRFTLSTGEVVLKNGFLDSFLVREGQIVIDGKGLNGSLTPYTDIYAHALRVNAGLYANNLTAILGQNDIQVSTDQKISSNPVTATVSSPKPAYALDVAQLGGMYAQKIYLVGTEHGLGVRNAGNINTSHSSLVLKANGDFVQSGSIIANKDELEIQAKNIANSGNLGSSQHKVTLNAENIQNSGLISTQDEIKITGTGQLNNDKGIINAGRIEISTKEFSNQQGRIQQIGQQKLIVDADHIDNTQGKLGQYFEEATTTTPDPKPTTPDVTQPENLSTSLDQSKIKVLKETEVNIKSFVDGQMNITGGINNRSGKIINNGEVNLNIKNSINNIEGEIKLPTLNFTGEKFDNQKGKVYSDHINIQAGVIDNTSGMLISENRLHLDAANLNNKNGLLQAKTTLQLNVEQTLTNESGHVISVGKQTINAGQVQNQKGVFASLNNDLSMTAKEIESQSGSIGAQGIVIATAKLNNSNGIIQAKTKNIQLDATEIKNDKSSDGLGRIIAEKNINIQSDTVYNAGQIYAGDALSLDTQTLQQNGQVAALNKVDLTADTVTSNQNAQWISGLDQTGELSDNTAQLTIKAKQLQNAGTNISTGNIVLSAEDIHLKYSENLAKNITIGSKRLDASDAKIIAEQNLNVEALQGINTQSGYISANNVSLKTTSIDNDNGVIQHLGNDQFVLDLTGDLENNAGKIISHATHTEIKVANLYSDFGEIQHTGQHLDIVTHDLSSKNGRVQTLGQLNIDTKNIDMTQGVTTGAGINIVADTLSHKMATLLQTDKSKKLNIQLNGELNNQQGILSSAGNTKIQSQEFNNTQGFIQVENNKNLSINSTALKNNSAQIISSGRADLITTQIENKKGEIYSKDSLSIVNNQFFDNQEGIITSQQDITLTSNALNNNLGFVQSDKNDLNLTVADELSNIKGNIQANQNLNVQTGQLENLQGQLVSGQSLQLNAQQLNNQSGQIYALENADLQIAGQFDNQQGLTASNQSLLIVADQINNDKGQIRSEKNTLDLNVSQALSNKEGLILSEKQMYLNTGDVDSSQGKIISNDDLDLIADHVNNQQGTIYSEGNIKFDVTELNNEEALVSAQKDIDVTVKKSINNDTGEISSVVGSIQTQLGGNFNNSKGKVIAKENLAMTANNINNDQGLLVANHSATIETHNNINNQLGTIYAAQDLAIKTREGQFIHVEEPDVPILARMSYRLSNGDDSYNSDRETDEIIQPVVSGYVSGPSIDNRQGQMIAEKGNLSVDVGAKLDNSMGQIHAQNMLNIQAGLLDNQEGQIISNNSDIVSTGGVNNTGGLIYSENQLSIDVPGLIPLDYPNNEEMAVFALDYVELNNRLDDSVVVPIEGSISDTTEHLQETIDYSLQNIKGNIISKNDAIQISVAKDLDNQQGLISAQKNIEINNARLANQNGNIVANQSIHLDLQEINNNQSGLIYSQSPLNIYVEHGLNNAYGKIISEQNLALQASSIYNLQGVIQAQDGLDIQAYNYLNNVQGVINSVKNINLNTYNLDNTQGEISSKVVVQMGVQYLNNIQGTVYAEDNLTVNGTGYINNEEGLLAAKQAVSVNTWAFNNNKGQLRSEQKGLELHALGSVSNDEGLILATENLVLTAQDTSSVKGKIISDQSVSMNTAALNNTEGTIYAKDALAITASGMVANDQGVIAAKNKIDLTVADLSNTTGQILSEVDAIRLTSTGNVGNQSGEISALKGVDVKAANISAESGKWISGDALTIQANDINNHQGTIYAEKDLNIGASGTINNNLGIVVAKQQVNVNANSIQNDAGKIRSERAGLNITTQAHVSNQAGEIYAVQDLNLQANTVHNQKGLISSTAAMDLAVNDVNNTQGTVYAENTLKVDGNGHIDNTEGLLTAKQAVTVNTGSFNNNKGQFRSEQKGLELHALGSVSNDEGLILATGHLALIAQDTSTVKGKIISDQSVSMNTVGLNNTEGTIYAKDALAITASGTVVNDQGAIAAKNKIDLTVAGLSNTTGQILSEVDAIRLTSTGNVGNQSGEISALKGVDVKAANISAESGKWISGDHLTIQANHIDTSKGTIYAGKELNIDATGDVNSHLGIIVGKKQVGIHANSINNNLGKIRSELAGLDIQTQQKISNVDGEIYAVKDINLQAREVDNHNGQINSTATMNLGINYLNNNDGIIYADGALKVDSLGNIDNIQGTIATQNKLLLEADNLNNHSNGKIYAKASLDVNVYELDNTQGSIYTDDDLILSTQNVKNTSGQIAANNLRIAAKGNVFQNMQGRILAVGQLDIASKELNNRAGLIQGGQDVKLDLGGESFINSDSGLQGGILSQGKLSIENARYIYNKHGLIASVDDQNIQAQTLLNQSGQIQSGSDLTIQQLKDDGELYNIEAGAIQAQGNINLIADRVYNTDLDSHIAANEKLTIYSKAIKNEFNTGLNNLGGLDAKNIEIYADTLSNQGGAIRAVDQGSLYIKNILNNKNGHISSQNRLVIGDNDKTLNIWNENGEIIAKNQLSIFSNQYLNGGKVISLGDLELGLKQSYINTKANELAVNGHLKISSDQDIMNYAELAAGKNLELSAKNITNYLGASVAGIETHLYAQNNIYNEGLINGELTHLQANHIVNNGAKIYGTQVSIQADTLNNQSNKGVGAIIASRQNMDLGIKVLNNQSGGEVKENARDNAWIFSSGQLNIGGRLDSNYQAQGSANAIYNRSSRIESFGDMQLNAGTIKNLNDNFTTVIGQVGTAQQFVYIQPKDSATKIPSSELYWKNWSRAGLYRYKIDQSELPENVVLGSTAIPYLEVTNCVGSDDSEVCATNYKSTNAAWAYFKITPPMDQPQAPTLSEPIAPVSQTSCDTATYNEQACKLYQQQLAEYDVKKQAYDQEQRDYQTALTQWENSDQSAYSVLDEAITAYNEQFINREIKAWTQYEVNHTEYETHIVTSAPAEMISGGNMNITANIFTNDKSHVLAGGSLTGQVGTLENIDGEGIHIIKEKGTSQYTKSRWRGGFKRYHQRDWDDKVAYEPADVITTIDLPVAQWKQYQSKANQQYQVGQLTTGGAGHHKASEVNDVKVATIAQQQADRIHANVNNGQKTTVLQGQIEQPENAKPIMVNYGQAIDTQSRQQQQDIIPQDLILDLAVHIGKDDVNSAQPDDLNHDFGKESNHVVTQPDALNHGLQDIKTTDVQQQQVKITDATQHKTVATGGLLATNDPEQYGIRIINQDFIKVPSNALFIVNTASQANYLVETDPAFAGYKNWLSSDYMLNALGVDPALAQKRMGDGYYEQRLVQDQIASLTGRRFLNGYATDEEQYKALMNNGLTFAKTYGLRPGIVLSAEQIAQLTSDIMWLEEKTVVLSDGSTTKTLVPQLYVKSNQGDLKGDGTLISADSIQLNVNGDVLNSAIIAGRQAVVINANNIDILNGRVQANQVGLSTKENLNIIGGQVQAKDAIQLNVGKNFNLESSVQSSEHKVGESVFSYTGIDRVAGLYTSKTFDSSNLKPTILVNVGGNAQLKAAEIMNKNGGTSLLSQGDLDIKAIQTEISNKGYNNKNNLNYETKQKDIGSTLQGLGDVYLKADNIKLNASQISSQVGSSLLYAQQDIEITAGRQLSESEQAFKIKSKSMFGSTTEQGHTRHLSDEAIASTIDGKQVVLNANNIDIRGSQIASDELTQIQAKNNINITAAENKYLNETEYSTKKSGFTSSFSDGVASIGFGKSSLKTDKNNQSTTLTQSQIISTQGNTNILAGKDLTAEAAILGAGKDLNLQGANVNLNAGYETLNQHTQIQSKNSGVSVGVTYSSLTAAASTYKKNADNGQFSDSAVGQVMSQAEAINKAAQAATTPIVVTAGSYKSKQSSDYSHTQAVVTQATAQGNLNIIATEGNINSQGAQLAVEGDALLHAKENINLNYATDHETQIANKTQSGWSIDNRDKSAPAGTYNNKNQGTGVIDKVTGTQLSVGGKTTLQTEHGDINILGSSIASKGDVNLNAARDINIKSTQNSQSQSEISSNKGVGSAQISDTEKFFGYMNGNNQSNSTGVEQQRSQVGSLEGNVNIQAGNNYNQQVADVVAKKDVNITAKQINVLEDHAQGSSSSTADDLKIGIFAKVSSPILDLINSIDKTAHSKADDRTQALQAVATGAQAYQSYSDIQGGALFKAEAGIGFSTSENQQKSSYATSQQNNITAGGNVNLTSTNGDIHLQNTQVKAQDKINLDSAKNILLESGQSQNKADGKNSNAGLSVGYGVSVGAQTGVYIYGEAGYGKGSNHLDSTTHNNTSLQAEQINLKSQGDTTLRGAQANANRIDAEVGGKLNIESLQDQTEQTSNQMGVGGRVQASLGTAWQASGNFSSSKASGDSKSVNQQSGLFAGDGGYHVKADSVDLKGGAIASTASKENNNLTANSLTFSNIENESSHKATTVALSGGTRFGEEKGTDSSGKTYTNNVNWRESTTFSPTLPQQDKDSDSSTTYATISAGNINIGGKDTTVEKLGIHSDINTANQKVDALPDLQAVLEKQKIVSDATSTIVAATRTYSQNKQAEAEAQKQAAEAQAIEKLKAEGGEKWAEYNSTDDYVTKQNLLKNALPAYKDASDQAQTWGMGGNSSRALNAVTTAITAALGGQTDLQVVTNTLAPYAAQVIGQQFGHGEDKNTAAQLVSHVILGATLAYINGGDPTAGGSAAAASEAAANYLTNQYKDKKEYQDANGEFQPNLLPENVKAQIRDLTAGIGAVIGGAVEDSSYNAQLAGVIGQNAVENNHSIASAYAKQKHEQYNKECAANGIAAGQCSEWTGQRILGNAKELAMIIVPTEVYEVIPVGKGYGIIAKGSKKIIATVKDSKQVQKVLDNITASQKARNSSNFNSYVSNEKAFTTRFGDNKLLQSHFDKHGKEFKQYGVKNVDDYLNFGQKIIRDGKKVEYIYKGEKRTGYVDFLGNNSRGEAKFALVGTNSKGHITTIHTQTGKDFWRTINGNAQDKVIRVVK